MTVRRLGLAPLGFLEIPPPEFISIAHHAGFDSVGIRTRPAIANGIAFPLKMGGELLRETRRRVDDTGVTISSVEQVGLSRDTDIRALREMIETGAEVGATLVVCSGDDSDPSIIVERFIELCTLASEYGMSACLEFMPFRALKSIQDAKRVVDAAQSKNGLIMIDALHLFRSGGNVSQLSCLSADQIGGIQLCDAPAIAPPREALAEEARERRLLPGEGELPLPEIISALPTQLTLDAEVPLAHAFPKDSPLELAKRIGEALRRLISPAKAV
jgi:sugar phosphate isomerase/epimerase